MAALGTRRERGQSLVVSGDLERMYFMGRAKADMDLVVSSFDMRTELFVNTNFPQGVFSNVSDSDLLKFLWNDCLALSRLTGRALQFMVLKNEFELSEKTFKVP